MSISHAEEVYNEIMAMIHREEASHPNDQIDVFLTVHPNLLIDQIGRYHQETLFFRGHDAQTGIPQLLLVHFSQVSLLLVPDSSLSKNACPQKPVRKIGFVGCPSEE